MMMKGQLKFGLVFTTTKFNGGFDWLPDKYVYSGFNMEVLQAWMKFLIRLKKAGKDVPTFIVFDDIINSIPQGTRLWSEFICTARHYGITLFFTTQYINKADSVLREQSEYVYFFALHTDMQFRATYENYGGLLRSLKAWKAYITKYTGDYKCVIWHKESRPTMEDRYKQFKAPPEPKKQIKFDY